MALTIAALGPSVVAGQACGTAVPGDSIRFRWAPWAVSRPAPERETALAVGDTLVGVLLGAEGREILVRVEGRDRAFHLLGVGGIETPCTRREFAPERLLFGGIAGGAAGILVAWVAGLDCVPCSREADRGNPENASLVAGLAIGAGVGLVGGFVAATLGRSAPGGWSPATLRFSPPLVGDGGWVFSVGIPVGPG